MATKPDIQAESIKRKWLPRLRGYAKAYNYYVPRLGLAGMLNWFLQNRKARAGAPALLRLRSKQSRYPLLARVGDSDLDVFYSIYIEQEYKPLRVLRDVVHVVDCGANVGYSAAWFLSAFPNCNVTAIEPDSGNLKLLRRNLDRWQNRARIIEGAVWSHATNLSFNEEAFRDGRSWAKQIRECRPGEDSSVAAVGVREVISQSGFARCSILKMDIEGAEVAVFGAKNLDWLDVVDNIVIELHDSECVRVFCEAIKGRGFDHRLNSGELLVCMREFA